MPPLGVVPVESSLLTSPVLRPYPRDCSARSNLSAACAGSEKLVVGEIVPNGVASAEPDPLGNGPVLLLGLGQLLLDLEGLVALLLNRLISI
jgi:hypothetical protein